MDVVQLGELAAIVRWRVGHELLVRLLAQVAGVDQKQDAPGAAELEQAVDRGDGGESLAGAGGHVDQGAWLVPGQRFFQAGDGADLAVAQVALRQRRHLGEAAAQGVRLRGPFGQGFGLEEVEQLAGARHRIGAVGEEDDLAGAFVEEAERRAAFAPLERGIGVALGLGFMGAEASAGLIAFGFDHADRLAAGKQDVVGRTGIGGIFAHRDTKAGAEIELLHVLDDPASSLELGVDQFPGTLFWCQRHNSTPE